MPKPVFALRSHRYVRRSHLCEIADNADRWNFNRKLDSEDMQRLPENPDLVYLVAWSFPHEHRYGMPCEVHMRLVIDIQEMAFVADVPLDYFEKLPKAYFVSKNGNGLLMVLLNEDGELWDVRVPSDSTDVDQAAVEYFMKHCDDPKVRKFVKAQMGSLV
jgi:hypothetical protein